MVRKDTKQGKWHLNYSMKFTLLIASLLTGCGVLPNITDVSRLRVSTIANDKAIVILSTGVPDNCGQTTALEAFPTDATYRSWNSSVTVLVANHDVKSDFADHRGFFHAIVLAPGAYYFAPMAMSLSGVSPIQIPRYDFSVAAGEVVYVGEYYCGPDGTIFRDQRQRDMDLLAQKNPTLARTNIIERIPKFSGFTVLRGKNVKPSS